MRGPAEIPVKGGALCPTEPVVKQRVLFTYRGCRGANPKGGFAEPRGPNRQITHAIPVWGLSNPSPDLCKTKNLL